jgi:hypothetical protein
LFGAVLFLALFASFAGWRPSGVGHAVSVLGPGLVVVFVLAFAACVTVALRRKATLTPDTLVVRTVWRTHRLPLLTIAEINGGKPSRSSFTKSLVGITTADRVSVYTMAFGIQPVEAVRAIVQACQAAGGQPKHPQLP